MTPRARISLAVAGIATAVLVGGALVGGAAYGSSSAAHASALEALEAQTADLTARVEASDRALAEQIGRISALQARLAGAMATAEAWKTELALGADAELTALEATTASFSDSGSIERAAAVETRTATARITVRDPNARPAAPEAPILIELRTALADRETRLADLTGRADALEQAAGAYTAAWRERLAAWAAATADAAATANPHAQTALQTVSSLRDRLVAVVDVFGADVPQTMASLHEAVAAAQTEEAAWQQAEAARIAEAARVAAEASRRSAPSGSGPSGGTGGSAAGGSGTDRTGDLLALVNQARAAAGLGALGYSSSLVGTSCAQSQWMSDTGNFAHGHTSGWSGENIAMGYSSSQAVFNGWMNSDGHRANILRPGFTRMGACQVGSYWTQQFG